MVTGMALPAVALAFVFVCGANDGGALLALADRHRPGGAGRTVGLLVAATVAGPMMFGLSVARTFTDRLVSGHGPTGSLTFLGGTAAAVLIVSLLTWRGVPTSVTLAILGGLAGCGAGLGLPPSWSTLARVLAIGLCAPLAGASLGYLFVRAARRAPAYGGMAAFVRRMQPVAFGGQCLAYAANDGQKMFAVAGVACGGLAGAGPPRGTAARPETLPLATAIAAVFALGALLARRRVLRGAAHRVVTPRPWQVVSAQAAASAAVLGTAALSAPVSMTQAMTGGLVGAEASVGARRVRWQLARPLLTAWLVTLPAGLAAGALAGLALRAAR